MRHDKRKAGELRPIRIQRKFTAHAGGSVLVCFGNTRVLCTAMIEKGVPPWLVGKGQGWLTAEYAMLPSSTLSRKKRDSGKPDGRSVEIQRLVGRCLRSVLDMTKLGENTLWIDCDVLQADGGTRTAAITGAWVALMDAVARARQSNMLSSSPVTAQVAAVSVGIVNGQAVADLDYPEDSTAEVDMNVAMLNNGTFVEVQATGEKNTFDLTQLATMVKLAQSSIAKLHRLQRKALTEK
ncbi:MAG: ribonuclease PH [Phycisphaerales bacterium]|nr:ribonuclease PH [Phycisphaerales bacterium]